MNDDCVNVLLQDSVKTTLFCFRQISLNRMEELMHGLRGEMYAVKNKAVGQKLSEKWQTWEDACSCSIPLSPPFNYVSKLKKKSEDSFVSGHICEVGKWLTVSMTKFKVLYFKTMHFKLLCIVVLFLTILVTHLKG